MELLRTLRTRFYYSALDAVYMAPTRAPQSAHEFLRDAFTAQTANFDRVGALACCLSAYVPRWMARVQKRLEREDGLPVRVPGTRRLASGTRCSCVILEGSPPRVLKFVRCSLGLDPESLVDVCRHERDEYETLQRWYADIPRLLLPTIHLVMRVPMLGLPAAAQIQDFVAGDHSDLFFDHSDEEIIARLERHDRFRTSFHEFVTATRRAWDEEGRFLDMAGYNNVLVLETGRGPELRVADFGIWDLARQRRVRPDLYAKAVRWMERLERIDARVTAPAREQPAVDSSRDGESVVL